ncbi:hypothetical protein AB7M35_001705 [Amorphus suaedae]
MVTDRLAAWLVGNGSQITFGEIELLENKKAAQRPERKNNTPD